MSFLSVFSNLNFRVLHKPLIKTARATLRVWGHSSQCSNNHWDLFGLHLQHQLKLFLQLLVLPDLFVLHLPDETVSEDWHIYLNCSLLLLVNHSQHVLADGQLISQVVSMALYAGGVVMTGKRPTHESKFQNCTLLGEILQSCA